jgi:hypothetical protein
MQKLTTAHHLKARLEVILATAGREFSSQSDAQFRWKPSPDRWSMLECLQHLNLAERYYIRTLQHKVDALGLIQTSPADQTLESDWIGKIMLYIVDPGTTMKFPAPGIIRPRRPEELSPAEVLSQFIELQSTLHDVLDKAVYLDWNKEKVSTLFGNWLKLRLGDTFLMLVAHSERHMNQAMRVRDEMSSLTQAH